MAEPSPSTSPDASIWRCMAGAFVEIPSPDSYVFYFPVGHTDHYNHLQNQAHAKRSKRNKDLEYQATKPFILCKVLSRNLSYKGTTRQQPRAQFLLQQVDKWCNRPVNKVDDTVSSYNKILTVEDIAENLHVPDASIFPFMDISGGGSVYQHLRMTDLDGISWRFHHNFLSNKHKLTHGWNDFVQQKRLVAGDGVTFIKKPGSEELFIGIKKSVRFISGARARAGANEVKMAVQEAEKGTPFHVTYYPCPGSPDFVVSAEKVFQVSKIRWYPGMQVLMTVESQTGTKLLSGAISSVRMPETGPLKKSPWKMLQVTWEGEPGVYRDMAHTHDTDQVTWEGEPGVYRDMVNPWEVKRLHKGMRFGPLPPSDNDEPEASEGGETLQLFR